MSFKNFPFCVSCQTHCINFYASFLIFFEILQNLKWCQIFNSWCFVVFLSFFSSFFLFNLSIWIEFYQFHWFPKIFRLLFHWFIWFLFLVLFISMLTLIIFFPPLICFLYALTPLISEDRSSDQCFKTIFLFIKELYYKLKCVLPSIPTKLICWGANLQYFRMCFQIGPLKN